MSEEKEYTDDQMHTMRKMLAERDASGDFSHTFEELTLLFLTGCEGYNNIADEDIIDTFETEWPNYKWEK